MTLLARLSFWAPAQRMDEFEALYEKRLVPLLKKHDLVEGCESDRAGVEGIFSRLFELASPAEVSAREQALYKDSAWQEELQDLGNRFGTTFAAIHAGVDTYHYGYFTDGMFAEMAELIHYQFGPYSAPAGAGRVQ